MKNLTLRYGIYSAFIVLAFLIITQLLFGTSLPYRTMEVIGYLTIIISLSLVFFGIKAYRDEKGDGQITFGKAFRVGLGITALPAAAFGLYTLWMFAFRSKEFMEYAMTSMNEAERQQMQEHMVLYGNPFFQGLVMFLTVFVIGLVISLLSALLLKRQNVSA